MAAGYRGTLRERMARKYTVDEKTGCWNWHGATDRKGYGQIRIAGRNRMATHIALELAGKPRTEQRPCALHKCDNPPCVNPKHLWWGTHQENMRDMADKGRVGIAGLEVGWRRGAAPLPVVICTACGKEYETTKAQFANNVRNFCSRECCWGWQSRHFTGTPRSQFAECSS